MDPRVGVRRKRAGRHSAIRMPSRSPPRSRAPTAWRKDWLGRSTRHPTPGLGRPRHWLCGCLGLHRVFQCRAGFHPPRQQRNRAAPDAKKRQWKQGDAAHGQFAVPQPEQRKVQQQPAPGKQGHKALGTQCVGHGGLLVKCVWWAASVLAWQPGRQQRPVRAPSAGPPLLCAPHLPCTYWPAERPADRMEGSRAKLPNPCARPKTKDPTLFRPLATPAPRRPSAPAP